MNKIGIEVITEKLKELYDEQPYYYIRFRSWPEEKLATLKAKVVFWTKELESRYGEAAGDIYKEGSAISILYYLYHDIEEELETQAYYRENPSPTRKEYAIKHGLDLTNL